MRARRAGGIRRGCGVSPDIMTEAELRRRGRLLFIVLTVLGLRWPSREPELVQALRVWLGTWTRMEHIVGGWPARGTRARRPADAARRGGLAGRPSTRRAASTPSS